LLSTQDENGYIGTYRHSDFLSRSTWNVWNQKYTLWGLVEAWEILQDESILIAAKRLADHLISQVDPGAVDIVKTGTHQGMASSSILQPMVKLYDVTGDNKYLDYAEYIVGQWINHPAGLPDIFIKGLCGKPVYEWSPETDPFKWAKAYEFLSCIEGLLELYEVTGNQQYFEAVQKLHAALVEWDRSPIGTISFNDKLIGAKGLINTISEICDVVYWNRLSFKLFCLTGKEKYIDEIERTLYNSLLSSFNPEGTWGLRRLRMSHIHIPAHNHWLQHHQCCIDNLPRSLFQAAEVVLTNREGNIYLSLFNEGEGSALLPSDNKVHVKIEGDFLEKDGIRVVLSLDDPEKFGFSIRMPRWSRQTIVNGQKQKSNVTDNWMIIDRIWEEGNVIDISFKLDVWWETFITTKFTEAYHEIPFYENKWAGYRFMGENGSNEYINCRYEHVNSLSPDDALPHKQAVVFFYGPIALARDVRITDGDIFIPVQFSEKNNPVLNPIKAPQGIWKAFELNLGQGQTIKFCDFSSAGNTWDDNSKFNTWCVLKTK